MMLENKNYKLLKIIIKYNNKYCSADLLLDKKEIINDENDITTIKRYNNIEVILPYIKIDDNVRLIGDYDGILPLDIFEKSYKIKQYIYFDYETFIKLNIKKDLIKYFGDIGNLYETIINNIEEYCEKYDYSDREFEEALIQYIDKRLNELNDKKDNLLEIFVLYSFLNLDYMELYSIIYNYIK